MVINALGLSQRNPSETGGICGILIMTGSLLNSLSRRRRDRRAAKALKKNGANP
jgi:hypothetical protein